MNVAQIVERMQQVADKMLALEVKFEGVLSYQKVVEVSARDLIPAIARYPKGKFSKNMGRKINNILHDR
jgi:hypothetical protein